jgi:hypothetical protein
MQIQLQRNHLSHTTVRSSSGTQGCKKTYLVYRGKDGVVLRGRRGRDARPGERRRRGRREADDGRAPAGAGEGRTGIGTALEERGVERPQLGGLGDGSLDVLARGREGRRKVGGRGRRGGLCGGHGDAEDGGAGQGPTLVQSCAAITAAGDGGGRS